MNNLNITPEYKEWFVTLKSKIRSVQIKAALAVSSALIEFYWDLGRMMMRWVGPSQAFDNKGHVDKKRA